LSSNLKAGHLRMRVGHVMCSRPVTWQQWRKHHSANANATRKLHGSVFYGAGVTDQRRLRKREFSTFLLLRPWPWPNDLHKRTWPVFPGDTYTGCAIYELYVKAFERYRLTGSHTYIQTERQTRPKSYTTPGWLKTCWANTSEKSLHCRVLPSRKAY